MPISSLCKGNVAGRHLGRSPVSRHVAQEQSNTSVLLIFPWAFLASSLEHQKESNCSGLQNRSSASLMMPQDRVEVREMRTSGQVRVVNQKHSVREMVEMPTRTPRSLHIMRSVPAASGTPSGNVATPLHSGFVVEHISPVAPARNRCSPRAQPSSLQ